MRFFLWFFKHCVLPTTFFSFHCYFPKWDFSHDWWSDLVLKPLFSFLSASSHLSPLKKCDEGWVWNAHSQELFKHFWSAQADIIQHGQCSKKRVLSTENQKIFILVLFWSSVLPSFWVHAEQVKASLSKSNMDAETLLSIWDAEHGVITDELRAYAKM